MQTTKEIYINPFLYFEVFIKNTHKHTGGLKKGSTSWRLSVWNNISSYFKFI